MGLYKSKKRTTCGFEFPYTIPESKRSRVNPVLVEVTCPERKGGWSIWFVGARDCSTGQKKLDRISESATMVAFMLMASEDLN